MESQTVLIAINNFQLLIVIVSTILFSLFYSFIIAKRNLAMTYTDKVKFGTDSPDSNQRLAFCIAYIKKYKSLNTSLVILALLSISLWVTTICVSIITPPSYSVFILYILHTVTFLLFISILFEIYNTYENDTQL